MTYQHQVIAAEGEERWQEWTDRALFDKQGTLFEYVSIGFDITERKKTELALQASRENLRALLDSNLEAVCLSDRSGNVLLANQTFARQVVRP